MMESVSALPFGVKMKFPLDCRSNPSATSSSVSVREIFQLSGRNSVARAQRKRDSLGAFHLIREILARFTRRLTGKSAIDVRAIIADILPALHPNGRNRARSDSQIIFAEPVGAIMN